MNADIVLQGNVQNRSMKWRTEVVKTAKMYNLMLLGKLIFG